ncbi:mycofactocin system transcriptional regulator [Leifsonia sp. NPDC080035]|uniref:Mycofactocin system transcriptional regulator n=1 Tax=Leifsonia sp. NPDC080035 TaxID=3143936 RepID=A0AAU7GAP4_9MICO
MREPISTQRGQRASTKARLGHIGLRLFIERGFTETTVDDIVAAAGIGRRTFFRYFASKNDLAWGDFDTLVEQFRAALAAIDARTPMHEGLREAVLEFNRYPVSELSDHRERMQLLLNVPALVAHSALRYASWRAAIADFAAERLELAPSDLLPQEIAWIYLAVSLSAYEAWLRDENGDLLAILGEALENLDRLPDGRG